MTAGFAPTLSVKWAAAALPSVIGGPGFDFIRGVVSSRRKAARGTDWPASLSAKAMAAAETEAEIEDFIDGFTQPTWRGQWGAGARLVETKRLEWVVETERSTFHFRYKKPQPSAF